MISKSLLVLTVLSLSILNILSSTEPNQQLKTCGKSDHKCGINDTCCRGKDGWRCCTGQKAVCCSDGISCCPNNTSCDVNNKRCLNKDGSVFKDNLNNYSNNAPNSNIVEFKSKSSGLCLGLNSRQEGEEIKIYKCDRNNLAVQWYIVQTGVVGQYFISNVGNGLNIDVNQSSTGYDAKIQSWIPLVQDNQKIKIEDHHDGNKILKFVHSDMCLDIANRRTDEGARVHQWGCHYGDNQLWSVNQISQPVKNRDINNEQPGAGNQFCGKSNFQCSINDTCCRGPQGWRCCAGQKSVCCSDGISCCPSGTTCDINNKRCVPKQSDL